MSPADLSARGTLGETFKKLLAQFTCTSAVAASMPLRSSAAYNSSQIVEMSRYFPLTRSRMLTTIFTILPANPIRDAEGRKDRATRHASILNYYSNPPIWKLQLWRHYTSRLPFYLTVIPGRKE